MEPPVLDGYRRLYESTGWTYATPVTRDNLRAALANTWCWASAYIGDEFAGAGRLISDGVLYAFLCDLIVFPEHQNKGIGSTLLEMLTAESGKHNIKRLWLFAATDKAPFYERFGFEVRSSRMPGMQLSDGC